MKILAALAAAFVSPHADQIPVKAQALPAARFSTNDAQPGQIVERRLVPALPAKTDVVGWGAYAYEHARKHGASPRAAVTWALVAMAQCGLPEINAEGGRRASQKARRRFRNGLFAIAFSEAVREP